MTRGPGFRFGPAASQDLERLATLRVAAMRESLERIGRFDPERAYRRMVDQYRPQHTRLILVDERLEHFPPKRPPIRRRKCSKLKGFLSEIRSVRSDFALAGCVALGPMAPGVRWMEHFYIDPAHQGRGLGSAVLAVLLAETDAAGESVELTVVRESPALRFYQRFGFVETGRDATDVFYRRQPSGPQPG